MIISLSDPKTSMTAAIDSFGAQLISLKDSSGKEYIWQRDPHIWPRCSPVLFPVVGNCRGGRTRFENSWYPMEQHGFCKDSDFSVVNSTNFFAQFCLKANEDTLRFYPYDFVLYLSYKLENGVLSMDYLVENHDSRVMYYCIGFHPGFSCPLENHENFDDYQLVFEKEETTHSVVCDLNTLEFRLDTPGVFLDHTRILPLSHSLFQNNAVFFYQIRSRKVSLSHKQTGKGVCVSYPDFETIAFWSPRDKNAPLICIEPWNGSSIFSHEDDEFSHRHHVQLLKPGQKKAYHMDIHIFGMA